MTLPSEKINALSWGIEALEENSNRYLEEKNLRIRAIGTVGMNYAKLLREMKAELLEKMKAELEAKE
jgi:hypothetical protein